MQSKNNKFQSKPFHFTLLVPVRQTSILDRSLPHHPTPASPSRRPRGGKARVGGGTGRASPRNRDTTWQGQPRSFPEPAQPRAPTFPRERQRPRPCPAAALSRPHSPAQPGSAQRSARTYRRGRGQVPQVPRAPRASSLTRSPTTHAQPPARHAPRDPAHSPARPDSRRPAAAFRRREAEAGRRRPRPFVALLPSNGFPSNCGDNNVPGRACLAAVARGGGWPAQRGGSPSLEWGGGQLRRGRQTPGSLSEVGASPCAGSLGRRMATQCVPQNSGSARPGQEVKPVKPRRPPMKHEVDKNKAQWKTMGPAKVAVPCPKNFLKKHSKEPKLPERKKEQDSKKLPALSVPRRTDRPVMGIQSNTNFIKTNAIAAVKGLPKKPQPISVDTRQGDKYVLETSGLVPKYIKKKDYGVTPKYLKQRNEEMKRAQEEYEASRLEYLKKIAMKQLPDEERRTLLQGLKKNWDEVYSEFQRLPVNIDTISKKMYKQKLESQLKQLEHDIEVIEKHKVIYIANE
ncbi:enkurin [Podargus strigoides]